MPSSNGAAPVGRSPVRVGARHSGLARKQVSDIQRARMIAAMVEVAGERGALDASVSHVVARSGVSRRTFYEIFAGREDCFLAAFDDAVERAAEAVASAYGGGHRWRERVRGGLTALLDFCEREPSIARLLFVDSLGGGPRALARRREVLRHLIDSIEEGRSEAKTKPPRLTAEGVVGAVLSVIHARLVDGQHEDLLGLVNPLMSTIVLPYLGRAAADKELVQVVVREQSFSRRAISHPLRELDMRLTYRTVCVLAAVEKWPQGSNRQIGEDAGISDQGQISRLLARLDGLGLIENREADSDRGAPNAWVLTKKGKELQSTIKQETVHA
jgi:AcrR family transcriptional regulator/DNA-binding MarR family transcriptional regulator